MEKEDNNNNNSNNNSKVGGGGGQMMQRATSEPEFVLQWGKRLRCVRLKKPSFVAKANGVVNVNGNGNGIRRRVTTSRLAESTPFSLLNRPSSRLAEGSGSGKALSPEKEERYYTTRGQQLGEEGGRSSMETNNNNNHNGYFGVCGREEKKNIAMPKILLTLSNKEKEEDFMAMRGSKLPHRPKKRAKLVQRTLLMVSPGAWLSDMCQERYEVREKKTPKKKPRGLKAMGAVDSESE